MCTASLYSLTGEASRTNITYNITFITYTVYRTFLTYTVYRRNERFKWKVLAVRIQLATDIRKTHFMFMVVCIADLD